MRKYGALKTSLIGRLSDVEKWQQTNTGMSAGQQRFWGVLVVVVMMGIAAATYFSSKVPAAPPAPQIIYAQPPVH